MKEKIELKGFLSDATNGWEDSPGLIIDGKYLWELLYDFMEKNVTIIVETET